MSEQDSEEYNVTTVGKRRGDLVSRKLPGAVAAEESTLGKKATRISLPGDIAAATKLPGQVASEKIKMGDRAAQTPLPGHSAALETYEKILRENDLKISKMPGAVQLWEGCFQIVPSDNTAGHIMGSKCNNNQKQK